LAASMAALAFGVVVGQGENLFTCTAKNEFQPRSFRSSISPIND
jgi:hypothetical protein